MKIRVIVLIAIAFALSPRAGAFALILEDNISASGSNACTFNESSCGANRDSFGTTFSHTALGLFTVDDIDVVLGSNTGTPIDARAKIFADGGTIPSTLLGTSDTVDISFLTSTVEVVNFPFSSPVIDLVDGVTYWLLVEPVTVPAGSDNIKYARDGGSNYVNGIAVNCNAAKSTCPMLIDLLFTISGTEGAAITPNEITTPFDGETITSVPFQPAGTCDSGTVVFLGVVIAHPDLGFIERADVACIVDVWTGPLMGESLFNFDDYTITIFPTDFFGPDFDIHNFNVDEPDNPVPAPPQAGVVCSGVSNLFLEGLCDILTFLFVPNAPTLQLVEGLFDTLNEKPPLGYLTVTLAAFDDLEQGVSSEELEGTADLSAYFDPIKTSISAILWMLFAVFLIRRVSTIRI